MSEPNSQMIAAWVALNLPRCGVDRGGWGHCIRPATMWNEDYWTKTGCPIHDVRFCEGHTDCMQDLEIKNGMKPLPWRDLAMNAEKIAGLTR